MFRWTLASTLLIGSLYTVSWNSIAVSVARAEEAVPADKPFTITVAKLAAKRGQPVTAQVIFRPTKGYHVNDKYPTKLKLKPSKDVSVPRPELGLQDAHITEQEGRFDVVLTANAAGPQTVSGDLQFAVCTATSCDPQRAHIAIEMKVE